MPTLLPDLMWLDGEFQRGLAVSFSATSGRITRVGPVDPEARSDGSSIALRNRALMPGFINAHSHAFQRFIRGATQWRPNDDSLSDFWSWRTAMYAAALTLTPDEIFEVSRYCFIEMLASGITAVGEFHYLQCDEEGKPYGDPNELAHRVLAAAEDAGIRIRLLNVAYARGGIDKPLDREQRRFATPDLGAFMAATSKLSEAVRSRPLLSIGVAPHSVRAVPREWLRPLHDHATSFDMPYHMHVSEQPAEVTAALAAWKRRPVEALNDEGVLDDRTTAVHATHLTRAEVAIIGAAATTICACPTTERDLGDGFLPGLELLQAGARIALGSDSQTVIDPFEDMRLLEYHERLRRLERVILTTDTGRGREVAPTVIRAATESGAHSLRLDAGRIAEGALADFVAVDLEHRALAGWRDHTLAACLALSASTAVVSDVWVGGVQTIRGARHRLDVESRAGFDRAMRRLSTRT